MAIVTDLLAMPEGDVVGVADVAEAGEERWLPWSCSACCREKQSRRSVVES